MIADVYSAALANCSIELPTVLDVALSAWAQYTIRVANRNHFQEKMTQARIPTIVHYPLSINRQPAFAVENSELKNADTASQQVISLPMHPYLNYDNQQEIIGVVQRIVASNEL